MTVKTILCILAVLICICCGDEPPSRLNLFRFFMGFGPEVNNVQKISFNPEAGLRFREQYEKKYGPRGQLLIERFGQGLGMQGPSLVDVDQVLDVPLKNKTRHYRTYDFNPPRNKTRRGNKTRIEADDTTHIPEEIALQ
ncbi:uncharacterized protein LOC124355816 [Homalodisca vitripennis]|uniref:uncharacterized protein LOC124355816 n=1 Tax=Homalodisca vitripennis TaxID=197043 RepID=UPI001EEAC932|nr:uncharacterized protein LOC124355816 [Homalodisca vitripennis]